MYHMCITYSRWDSPLSDEAADVVSKYFNIFGDTLKEHLNRARNTVLKLA